MSKTGEKQEPSAVYIPTGEEILANLKPYLYSKDKKFRIGEVEYYLYPLGELAKALHRRPVTLRKWEEHGVLPTCRLTINSGNRYSKRRLYSTFHIIGTVQIAAQHGVLDPSCRSMPPEFRQELRHLFNTVDAIFAKTGRAA